MGVLSVLKLGLKQLGKKVVIFGVLVLILVGVSIYNGTKNLDSIFQTKPIQEIAPIANESQLKQGNTQNEATDNYITILVHLSSELYVPRNGSFNVYQVDYIYINATFTSNKAEGTYERVNDFINTLPTRNLTNSELVDLGITVQNTLMECLSGKPLDNATKAAWAVLGGLKPEEVKSVTGTCNVNKDSSKQAQISLSITANNNTGKFDQVLVTITAIKK